jgi:hypothetical protein
MAGVAHAASLSLSSGYCLKRSGRQGNVTGGRVAAAKLHCQGDALANAPVLVPVETGRSAGWSRKEVRACAEQNDATNAVRERRPLVPKVSQADSSISGQSEHLSVHAMATPLILGVASGSQSSLYKSH